jgi:Ser/Thr protein kinase RdoA (MazF antagonist)
VAGVARGILAPEVAAGVSAALGGPVTVVRDLTPPWSATTRSVLVTAGRPGNEAVVQWAAAGIRSSATDRAAIRRRMRLGRDLAARAPWLPLPPVLGGDPESPVPYVITGFVDGRPGREMLEDDAGAARLGAAAGRLWRGLGRVPVAGIWLSRTWSEPDLLTAAAGRWLVKSARDLGAAETAGITTALARLPAVFGGVAPAFAHGDLAPVNLVLAGAEVAGLLDLERARLAHPLFDAATWRWVVRYHHPAREGSALESFLEAAGLPRDARTAATLDTLALLQCLEALATTPRSQAESRREWARRVAAVLAR